MRGRGRFLITVGLAALAVSGLLLFPSPPIGNPQGQSHVRTQYTSTAPTVDSSTSVIFTAAAAKNTAAIAVTAGDVVYAVFGFQTTARTITNVKDNHGDTFTSIGSATIAATITIDVYVSNNVVGSATNAVFLNLSGTATGVLSEVAVKGQNLTSSQQALSVTSGSTGTNATCTDQLNGAQTPTVNNGLLMIGCMAVSNPSYTAIGGNAKIFSTASGTTDSLGVFDQAQATAAAITNQITLGSSQSWAAWSWDVRPALRPNTPTGFSCGSPKATSVACSWTDPAPSNGITNHTIYYWASSGSCPGSPYTASVSAGTSSPFTVTGLTSATSYGFRIGSWNATGQSAALSSCSVVTTHAGVPTGLSVGTITSTSITVSWTNPAGTIANNTVYEIPSGCSGTHTVTSLGGSGTSSIQSALSSATTYCFAVQAWSSSGSDGQTFINGTTLPAGITGLTFVKATTTSLQFSWTNPAGTLSNDSIAWTTTACTGSWSFGSLGVTTATTLGGLASATKYCLAFQAYSSSGASAPIFTNETTLPLAVTGITITALTSTGFHVSWTNPSGTLANISIFYGTSCSTLGTHSSLGVVTSTTLPGLTSATTYCVEIQAWTTTGNGAPAFSNGTTVPATPTGLAVTVTTSSSLAFTWTNSVGTIANVTVVLGTSCGTWTVRVSAGVVTQYTAAGLAAGTTYCIAVYDWSSSGAGGLEFTNGTTSASTLLAPSGVVVSAVAPASVSLSWINPYGTVSSVSVFWGLQCNALAWTATFGDVTTATITTLQQSTTYCFEVEALGPGVGGTNSTAVTATTSGPGGGGGGTPGQGTSPLPGIPISNNSIPAGVAQLGFVIRFGAAILAGIGVVVAIVADRRRYQFAGGALFLLGLVVVIL